MNQIVDLEKKVSEAEHALLRSKYEMGVAHQAEMDRIKTTVRIVFCVLLVVFLPGRKKSFATQICLRSSLFDCFFCCRSGTKDETALFDMTHKFQKAELEAETLKIKTDSLKQKVRCCCSSCSQ
jgi:hypothetical protein